MNIQQLYIIPKTRLLLLRVHVRLNHSTCHRRRPPPVRRESRTTTREVAMQPRTIYCGPYHTKYLIPNQNNQTYIQHCPIATQVLKLTWTMKFYSNQLSLLLVTCDVSIAITFALSKSSSNNLRKCPLPNLSAQIG